MRSVVTSLYSNTNLKEISIRRFMRWSLGVDMGVMPRYVKTPLEVTDIEVLNQHPYIFMWKELLPLKNYLPQYKNLLQFNKIAYPKLDEIYTRRSHLAKLKEKLKQLRHKSKHRRNA